MRLDGTDKCSARWPLNNARKIMRTGYPAARNSTRPPLIRRPLDGRGRGGAKVRSTPVRNAATSGGQTGGNKHMIGGGSH
jgi:hypothetical protein